jgi:hypothetical protein
MLITVSALPTVLNFLFYDQRVGFTRGIIFLNNRDGTTDGFNFSFMIPRWLQLRYRFS